MIRQKSHLPLPEWNAQLLTVEIMVTCFGAVNVIELETINILKIKYQYQTYESLEVFEIQKRGRRPNSSVWSIRLCTLTS
jgi:hypothetical protein